jgi:putative tricarboxylic transport membrane protein
MQNDDDTDQGPALLSNRSMEIVVALLLLGGCAIVLYDSVRIGFGWREGEGPAPGYFPFWVAVILGISSLINLWGALRGRGAGEIFVSARPFGRVLAVLIPSVVYVALIGGFSFGPVEALGIPLEVPALGIYVASAIFIFGFMILIGRENPIKALGVSVLVPVMLFFMFERWFLVPLPKGPLEAWLGY